MTFAYIIPIILFTFTMSITPGPNNIMVTASGANFGYRRTIPHLMGIWFGFCSIMVVSALGLKQFFNLYPLLKDILKYSGVSYMLFLAWKIARSKRSDESKGENKPISFFQAAVFQIINPKAIMMAITVISVYTLEGELYYSSVLMVISIFFLIGFPSTSAWAVFGMVIGKMLQKERNLKIFNFFLAGLTVCSAVLLFR